MPVVAARPSPRLPDTASPASVKSRPDAAAPAAVAHVSVGGFVFFASTSADFAARSRRGTFPAAASAAARIRSFSRNLSRRRHLDAEGPASSTFASDRRSTTSASSDHRPGLRGGDRGAPLSLEIEQVRGGYRLSRCGMVANRFRFGCVASRGGGFRRASVVRRAHPRTDDVAPWKATRSPLRTL